MSDPKRKRKYTIYILPILFCGLLIALAVLKGGETEQPVKAVLQEGEPLALTDQAMENYLFSVGFTLNGEAILNGDGQKAAAMNVGRTEDGAIESMTLTFPLTTYIPTEDDAGLEPLKAAHDDDAQRGEELFLSLFDAISATDKRVANRRDSALEKLRKTMSTGKASVQNANSWRFSFSLEPDLLEGTVTIHMEKVK